MYITETEPSKNMSPIESCTFLVGAPNLQLICNAEWKRWGIRAVDNFIQDLFEVKNPDIREHPYLFLPTGYPTLIFILYPKTLSGFLCGPLTKARSITVPAKGSIFCVRLVPGSMNWFGTGPAFYLADQVVPLYKYMMRAYELLQSLCSVHTYEQRCIVTLNFLNHCLTKQFDVEPMIQEAIKLINRCKGIIHVYDVAKGVCHRERYVSLVFRDSVGLTIKTYCEIVKFQHSLYSITTEDPRCLSHAADKYGYYDLPHMNRAYKKFLGYTANEIKHLNIDAVYVPDLFCDG